MILIWGPGSTPCKS